MEEKELVQKLENIELSPLETPGYQHQLRQMLMRAGQPRNARVMEITKPKTWWAEDLFRDALCSPIFKPALAIAMVLALTLALVPVLNNPASKVSASNIALSDPQVIASFTPDELTRLNIQELNSDNGQKVVLLTCDAAMVAVSVDVTAKRISEWLVNVPGFQPAPVPPRPYQLFFESRMSGIQSIYVTNIDGSNQTKLTDNEALHSEADWSVINQKIVLTIKASDLSATRQIYTMNADGTGLARLAIGYQPKWSPDGKKIVYNGNYQIFVMNADGSKPTNLTNNGGNNFDPQWSPDGKKIAYTSNVDGNWDIYTINSDGTGNTNISNNPAEEETFCWSPDSKSIAFVSDRGGDDSIYIVNVGGSYIRKLTGDKANESYPAWSSDGNKIAFVSNGNGYKEIYAINSDGTDMTKLTNNESRSLSPIWSPDSQQIAYNVLAGSVGELYVMKADGSNSLKVSENGYSPIWVSLPNFPAPLVPQYDIVPAPMQTKDFPVQQQQAIALASKYLPAGWAAQAKTNVSFGWSLAWGNGEPRVTVTFDNISNAQVNKADLGWESQFKTIEPGSTLAITPLASYLGKGPFNRIIVTLSGLDGSLKSMLATSDSR